jgi:hypothetical protein
MNRGDESPSPSGQPARGFFGGQMKNVQPPVLLRSVEDLNDAKELRLVIAAVLGKPSIDEMALRCAVWVFVGTERRAGVPPEVVIGRLTTLVDDANVGPLSARLALKRQVILWCVEEYFGHLGGDAMDPAGAESGSACASQ